jgi:hypothetical protein
MVDVRVGLCLLLLSCGSGQRQASYAASEALTLPQGYSLAWSDEFDGEGLPDPAKWAFDTEYNAAGWHNDEKQYYSDRRLENARVAGGRLIIEARAERWIRRTIRTREDRSSPRHGSLPAALANGRAASSR